MVPPQRREIERTVYIKIDEERAPKQLGDDSSKSSIFTATAQG